MAAARAGDRGALDLLLRRHHDRLHAVCRRITGSAEDADDATQDALVRIVRSLDRFDGRAAFSTWAFRIATNAAIDELRRRRRRPILLRSDDDGETSADRAVDHRAQREVEAIVDGQRIDAAMATLPEEHRIAVVLRDVADLDYDEIAAICDVPLGTVKSRIARGRARLIRQLSDQHPSSGPDGNQNPSPERRSR